MNFDLPVLKIGSMLLSPIISAAVELAKHVGMPKQYARFLSGALSAAVFAVMLVLEQNPTYVDVAINVVLLLAIFLSNAGFYHIVIKKD